MNDQLSQPPPPTTPPLSPVPDGSPAPHEEVGETVPSRWGPARVLVGILFLIAIIFVASVIVLAANSDTDSIGVTIALQILLGAGLVVTAFLFAAPDVFRGWAAPARLGLRRPLRSSAWLSIATYFGYIGCALLIALLLSPDQEDITRELGSDEGALGTVIAGILVVAVAPITEEIFFRGFVYPGFKRRLPPWLAAVLASVIWGWLHYTGPGTLGVVVQITVFGLWLTWLYERTGSIYPTIAVHAVNNAVAFTILLAT